MFKRIVIILTVLLALAGLSFAGNCGGRYRYVAPAYVASAKVVTVVKDYTPIISVYQPYFLAVPAIGGSYDPATAALVEQNRILTEQLRLFRDRGISPQLPPPQPAPQAPQVKPLEVKPTEAKVPDMKPEANVSQAASAAVEVLAKNCAECHTGQSAKGPKVEGTVRPFVIFVSPGVLSNQLHRGKIYNFAHKGTMPPSKPLPDNDVAVLLEWLALN